MPILDVDRARSVIVMKRRTSMPFGDAGARLARLIGVVEHAR